MSNPVSATQTLPQTRTRRHTARRILTFSGIGIAVLTAACLGVIAAVSRPDGNIAPGVRLAGQDLGGKTPEQAKQQITEWAKQFDQVKFALKFASETGVRRVWKSTAGELGLKVDTQATLSKVTEAAQPGVFARVTSFVSSSQQNQDIPPVVTIDDKKLRAVLGQIGLKINRKAQNARIKLVSGGFNVTKETVGLKMDIEKSVQAVNARWEEFKQNLTQPAATPDTPLETPSSDPPAEATSKTSETAPGIPKTPLETQLVANVTLPKLTAELLKQMDTQPIGSYSTHFGGTGASRGSNIALAASKIDGTVLAPGEVFSYNNIVGSRTASAGFKNAPVIVKGELVPGIGGGICQVSTTLYNAALLSDLKIVRRSHHAFPVHYVPAGRDATVVDGAIDFQFENSTDAPIVIAASSRGGRLSFRILGKRTPGKSVSIALSGHTVQAAPVRTIPDKRLPAGKTVVEDSGHRGHRVTVYRIVKQDGEVVKRERIANDVYRVFPRVVRVGTGVSAKPKPSTDTKTPVKDGVNTPTETPSLPSDEPTPEALP